MRKKRKIQKKKFNFSRLAQAQRQVVAVILITVAIILFLGLFNLAGVAGEFLVLGLEILFGWAAWFIPIILIIAALISLYYLPLQDRSIHTFKKPPSFGARFLGLFFLVVIVASLFHIYLVDDQSALQNYQGGGYIGYALSYLMVKTFGFWASWVILAGIFIILFIVSFAGIFKFKGKQEEILTKESFRQKISRGLSSIFKKDDKLVLKPEVIDKLEEPIEEEVTKSEKRKLFSSDQDGVSEINVYYPKNKKKIEIPLDLLGMDSGKPNAGDVKGNKLTIQKTLENFSIPVEMGEVKVGPTVTQYTLKPAEGIKLSQIMTLHNDLAMALAVHPIRIEAPIPGQSLVGIEVPNQKVAIIRLKQILASETFKKRKSNLTLALGRDVAGSIWLADLAKMPHMLVAGATGSGKTIFLNSLIISLIYQNSPEDLRFMLIDPKRVELTFYNDLPHLLTPVITEVDKTVNALKWLINEMDRRFDIMHEAKKRDIQAYNQDQPNNKLPYIIVIIDELADLMVQAAHEVESCIIRLAQMARATGIHLIMATQRPSVDVITGLIKANITSRAAFSVASSTDSRTILDFSGAEKLLGRGDMLFISPELSKPKRLQGAYVSDQEIKSIVDYLKNITETHYESAVTEYQATTQKGFGELKQDEMLPQAREIVIQTSKASASFLQRRLRIGYARAARLLDLLEEEGTIGPADGAKPRDVYVEKDETEDF
ncbi:DNA translocase FtsK 4TM domain-containing protein [Patescibacteria group bacterium]|nr:DNA translocase FtsK 4TM domain-containing protein [Patescibacteria group bacterium]